MSRKVIYQDERLTAVEGDDHVLGKFIQLYDIDKEEDTPEGEGIIFDWSEKFGVSINLTGYSKNIEPYTLIGFYIKEVALNKANISHMPME